MRLWCFKKQTDFKTKKQ